MITEAPRLYQFFRVSGSSPKGSLQSRVMYGCPRSRKQFFERF